MQEFGDWFREHGYWYDQEINPWGTKNLNFFARVIAPKARLICEKWQIRDPYSPDWDFTRSGVHQYKTDWEAFLPTDCSEGEIEAMWDFSFLLMSEFRFRRSLRVRNKPLTDYQLGMTFDLRRPLRSLLLEAKEGITSRKVKYDRRHRQPPRISPAIRRRLDLYDTYLKVWDLRASREKFEAIGAQVFRDEPGRAHHAKDSFRRAKELIDGGYRELR
jgi:hypothetical protein